MAQPYTPEGPPELDVVLEPGDVLYLPRGWWHNPSPLGEESLHLAIGTFPALVMDYLGYLLEGLQNFAPARAAFDAQADESLLRSIATHFTEQLLDRSNHDAFMQQWLGGQWVESNLALEVFGRPPAQSRAWAGQGPLISSGRSGSRSPARCSPPPRWPPAPPAPAGFCARHSAGGTGSTPAPVR